MLALKHKLDPLTIHTKIGYWGSLDSLLYNVIEDQHGFCNDDACIGMHSRTHIKAAKLWASSHCCNCGLIFQPFKMHAV